MPFHELHDPRGMAEDVTNLGRWGHGDVEINLGEMDELPYVLGLVRQAFERQMGNEEEEPSTWWPLDQRTMPRSDLEEVCAVACPKDALQVAVLFS